MDELIINSEMLKRFLTRAIKKKVKSKTGYDVGMEINTLELRTIKGEAQLHIDINANLSEQEVQKLLSQIIHLL